MAQNIQIWGLIFDSKLYFDTWVAMACFFQLKKKYHLWLLFSLYSGILQNSNTYI